jgi:ABC-type proline/glycine betaine transport system permease subunit
VEGAVDTSSFAVYARSVNTSLYKERALFIAMIVVFSVEVIAAIFTLISLGYSLVTRTDVTALTILGIIVTCILSVVLRRVLKAHSRALSVLPTLS